jgi:glutaredoxin
MNEITIYTRPTCMFSNKLKAILKARGIAYKDYDVTKNEAPHHVVDQDGNIPVPQVEYAGRIIYDYKDEESLADEIQRIMKEF